MAEVRDGTGDGLPVDADALREEVREKYREVATDPRGEHHFHTGRFLARHLGYDDAWVDDMPEPAIESFAGIANPFALRRLEPGERIVDIGSGAGYDTLVAAQQVGNDGYVVGVDMTDEMLNKARRNAELVGAGNVEFRSGLAEELPVEERPAHGGRPGSLTPRIVGRGPGVTSRYARRPCGRALTCRGTPP
jgi:arsenite methyltransferase